MCMRKQSARPARRGGGWWHSFIHAPLPLAPLPRQQPRATSAPDVDHVGHVLRTLVDEHLTLSSAHRDSLLARGLTREVIERNGYASAPTRARAAEIVRSLSPLGLEGVPGFYLEGGTWRMAITSPGFYVPVRDEHGRVSGLQLRRDSGSPKYLWLSSSGRGCGTSSGAPPSLLRRRRRRRRAADNRGRAQGRRHLMPLGSGRCRHRRRSSLRHRLLIPPQALLPQVAPRRRGLRPGPAR